MSNELETLAKELAEKFKGKELTLVRYCRPEGTLVLGFKGTEERVLVRDVECEGLSMEVSERRLHSEDAPPPPPPVTDY